MRSMIEQLMASVRQLTAFATGPNGCGWDRCALMLLASLAIACQEPISAVRVATLPANLGGMVPGESWQYLELAPTLQSSVAHAINDSGLVVGAGRTQLGVDIGWRWRNGTLSVLKMPVGSTAGAAYDVNLQGTIVGEVTIGGAKRAFVRAPQGVVTVLPILMNGDTDFKAYGINDLGAIVGLSSPSYRALLWTSVGGVWTVTDIGTLPGGSGAYAYDINNDGWVVGIALDANGKARGFVQIPRQAMQDVGSLEEPNGSSSAFAVNDQGEVLGMTDMEGEADHYYLWTNGGGMTALFTGVHVNAVGGLSDKSRATGATWAQPADGGNGQVQSRAFTVLDGIYSLLPVPANSNSSAGRGVNSCGTIAGSVHIIFGKDRAVRWQRVVGPAGICD